MTEEQGIKMNELQKNGYVWDKAWSTSACAVILKKSEKEFWLFGLQGEIMHNPKALLTIKL